MSVSELQHRLFYDLRSLNLPIDEVDIYFRPYSKTYYGRYFPVYDSEDRPKMYLYPLENRGGDYLCYDKILETAVHEMIHHIQYSNGHVRYKGEMHDTEFWKLYNFYMSRAREKGLVSYEVAYA